MRAKDILSFKGHEVVTIRDDARLADAIGTLSSKKIGSVIVLTEGGDLAGILSERDIIRLLDGAPTGYRETSVRDVMTKTVTTATPDTSIDDILSSMTEGRFRHMPVLENGSLMGMISIGDVVSYRIREATAEAEALKDYIAAG